MERYFAFTSAGAYHVQSLGDWNLRADADGTLAIEHSLFGSVKRFGPFRLHRVEAVSLWERIGAADLTRRRISSRRGSPEEALLGFALFSETRLHNLQLWAGEAYEDPAIHPLLEQITGLTGKYAGKTPVLR